MTDCKRCGHSEVDHQKSLFGIVCVGKEWHDDTQYRCSCQGFVPKETAHAKTNS